MIYAFTEAEKREIESHGMMVIEFKRDFRKVVSLVCDSLMKFAEKISRAINVLCETFSDVEDNVRFAIEIIRESYTYHTSKRYMIVKILSKCTGLEKREVWKMTHRTHLARSYC